MMKNRFVCHGYRVIQAVVLAAVLGLSACDKSSDLPGQSNFSKRYDLMGVGASTRNYSPWYIHTWGMEGPKGSGVEGGGPNVLPAESDDKPSGGGAETCCSAIPSVWQPDLRLTVRWLVDKKQDGKTPGYWYKAENVRLPEYGKRTGGLWAVFLPGDRVRLMVMDGTQGENNPWVRPLDDDPYMAHGVIDEEWNRLYRDGGNAK